MVLTFQYLRQIALLRGLDTDEFDHFGYSVSLDRGVALVGAPSADDEGTQTYSFSCNATQGYFVLSLQRFRSRPVTFNASYDEFLSALRGTKSLREMPIVFPYVRIDGWDNDPQSNGGRVCSNNSFHIVLETPKNARYIQDLGRLEVASSSLNGLVTISDTRALSQTVSTIVHPTKGVYPH